MENQDEKNSYLDLPSATDIVRESIFLVVNQRDKKVGTGFVVAASDSGDKVLCATAAHVTYMSATREDGGTFPVNEPGKEISFSYKAKQFEAELFLANPHLDIAIYGISGLTEPIPALPILSHPIKAGVPVGACGFIAERIQHFKVGRGEALRNYLSFVSGIISARVPPDWTDGKNVYQLDCTLYPGMSGGPVFVYGHDGLGLIGLITESVPILSAQIPHAVSWVISLEHLTEQFKKGGLKSTLV